MRNTTGVMMPNFWEEYVNKKYRKELNELYQKIVVDVSEQFKAIGRDNDFKKMQFEDYEFSIDPHIELRYSPKKIREERIKADRAAGVSEDRIEEFYGTDRNSNQKST